jgi:transmembrane sensor
MSPDRTHEDWSRYARHLAGEETPAESERTRRQLAEDGRRGRDADEAYSTWHATAPAVDAAAARRAVIAAGADAAWSRLAARMSADGRETAHPARRRGWPGLRVLASVAAAAALFAAVGLLVESRAAARAATWRVYTTPRGQRAAVYLPDGSRADLRPSTTLRVGIPTTPRRSLFAWLGARSAPTSAARVVELSGEAIFTVVHDSTRPFRVVAGAAVAEDLGTKFAVRAYAGEPTVRVVVAEGAVAVTRSAAAAGSGARLARLVPGDIATIDSTGGVAVTGTDDPGVYLAWAADRLVFRGERLAAVIADLNRAYDARLVVRDSALAGRRVTIDMPVRTLGTTIETLSALLGVDVRPAGDSLVLTPRATGAR